MIILSFKKDRQKYTIRAKKGEELLIALDKFLKKNKMKHTSIKNWQLYFFQLGSFLFLMSI